MALKQILQKMFLCLFTVTLIFVSLNSRADTEKSGAIYEGRPITVTDLKPTFTLTLPANPTTGYLWFLKKYDPNLIQPLKHVYVRQSKMRIGGGGSDKWRFKVKPIAFSVPHKTTITLVYKRPWEKTPVKVWTFEILTSRPQRIPFS